MNRRLGLVVGLLFAAGCSKAISPTGAPPFHEPGDDRPMGTTPRAYVRYVPERVDDIAWENDRTAFRIYGPELETAAPPLTAGIDAWGKRVRYPIINRWYGGKESYHIDRG